MQFLFYLIFAQLSTWQPRTLFTDCSTRIVFPGVDLLKKLFLSIRAAHAGNVPVNLKKLIIKIINID